MGKRGPQPLPNVIHIANDNPSKKNLKDIGNEPTPQFAIPDCPDHLDEEAKKEWHWIGNYLLENNLVTKIDKAVLALYCQSYSRWVYAEGKVAEYAAQNKLVGATPKGYPIANPWLKIAEKAMAQVHKFAREFGMTPSARTGIRIPKREETKNAWQQFLDRKKNKTAA